MQAGHNVMDLPRGCSDAGVLNGSLKDFASKSRSTDVGSRFYTRDWLGVRDDFRNLLVDAV
jgi:hypothetical protein